MPRLLAVVLSIVVLAVGSGVQGQGPMLAPPEPPPRITVQGGIQPAQGSVRDPVGTGGVRRIPLGTATLSGIVVATDTGQPLPNARVSIGGQASGAIPASAVGAARGLGPATAQLSFFTRQAVTNAEGRFVFQALPAGQYSIDVTRDQYLSVSVGQAKPGRPGMQTRVDDGQSLSLTIRLPRGGVITGTVLGLDGLPQARAQVNAMRFSYASGVRRATNAAGAQTDDRGIYRLWGLQPGEYIVSTTVPAGNTAEFGLREQAAFDAALGAAVAAGGTPPAYVVLAPPTTGGIESQPAGYAPSYAPGTAVMADALRISVDANEERAGVDIVVQPVRTGNITGVVAGLPAGVVAQVLLVSQESSPTSGAPGTQTSWDGSFTLRNVQPGRYKVVAVVTRPPTVVPSTGPGMPPQPLPQVAPEDRLWARADVVVEGQQTSSVAMALEKPKTISGSLVFDTSRPVNLERSVVTVTTSVAPSAGPVPQQGPAPTTRVGPDGRFVLTGVVPGRYVLRVNGVGAFVRSIVHNADDVADGPLEVDAVDVTNVVITMADAGATVAGTLSDAGGNAAPGINVVVAAADRRLWVPGSRRLVATRTDANGRYRVGNLPAGSYLLAAVMDLEPGGQFDPAFLAALSGASIPVTLSEGATLEQDVRVAQ